MVSAMPPTLVVSREEWDAIRADVSTLFDCHRTIRDLAKFVFEPDQITDLDRAMAGMHLQHFFKQYPMSADTPTHGPVI